MDTQRITSNWIQELKPNEIFVFGSNLEGQHGGGAALLAYRKWGLSGDKAWAYKVRLMAFQRCMVE